MAPLARRRRVCRGKGLDVWLGRVVYFEPLIFSGAVTLPSRRLFPERTQGPNEEEKDKTLKIGGAQGHCKAKDKQKWIRSSKFLLDPTLF